MSIAHTMEAHARADVSDVTPASNQAGTGLRVRRDSGRPVFIRADEVQAGAARAIAEMMGSSMAPPVSALLVDVQRKAGTPPSDLPIGVKQPTFRQRWLPRLGPEAMTATFRLVWCWVVAFGFFLAFAAIGIVAGATNREYRTPQLAALGLAFLTGVLVVSAYRGFTQRLRAATGVPRVKFGLIPHDEDLYIEWCKDNGVTANPYGPPASYR